MKCLRSHPRAASIPVVLLLVVCARVGAVDFAGGTGEPNDPYQIATAEQLLAMDDDPNLYDKHFALVANIDLDPDLPGGKVFSGPVLSPWGISTGSRRGRGAPFAGSLDGNGHAIRNVVLYNMSGSLYAGLFDSVGPSAKIRNLRLEDVVIADSTDSGGYCGALAGVNAGSVVNCSATGTILTDSTERSPSPGGGLIGLNSGFVVDCHANCDVFGGQVGGLVGENDETGRIVHCSSNGIAIGDETAGGLVGTNGGMVQYSFAEGNVLGNRPGGLVGSNDGMVRACYAEGNVSGNWSVGGIAARNSGQVVDCYVTGSVLGDGLVGINEGTIASSYSTTASQVAPPSRRTRRSLGIESMPSANDLASAHLRSISGMAVTAAAWPVSHLYYLDPNKPEDPSSDSYSFAYGVPLAPSEMERQASFLGFDFYGDPTDGGRDHWFMPESGYPVLTWQTEITGLSGIPDVSGLDLVQARILLELVGFVADGTGYEYSRSVPPCTNDPRLAPTCDEQAWQAIRTRPHGYASLGNPVEIVVSLGPYDFDRNPGDGSESDPYQIETPGQLDSLYDQEDLWGRHFVLTADIDMAGRMCSRALIQRFSGTFDGNGHTIRGFHIPTQSWRDNHWGLFGIVESDAIVHDLILEQANLEIGSYDGVIGILAGENNGQVLHCAAHGQIFGWSDAIGGLVGLNAGQITNCRARVQLYGDTNSSQIGGLVGVNTQSIFGCSANDVTISGGSYVGGLAGISHGSDAHVEACYARGAVQGAHVVGGLLGANGRSRGRGILPVVNNGTVRHCYATCSVTAQDTAGGCIGAGVSEANGQGCYFLDPNDGGGPENGYGIALSDIEMRQQASFVDWDFETVWTICEGQDYPRLQWEDADNDDTSLTVNP